MKNSHSFIFTPSRWLGEGKIRLSMVEEELPFHTRWTIAQKDEHGKIECTQDIQIRGLSELMHNQLLFFDLASHQFSLELDNPTVGRVVGKGLLTNQMIAWEFRVPAIGFEGFETYEKQQDGSYSMHAEYATDDQLRTVIKGKIWQETSSKSS